MGEEGIPKPRAYRVPLLGNQEEGKRLWGHKGTCSQQADSCDGARWRGKAKKGGKMGSELRPKG